MGPPRVEGGAVQTYVRWSGAGLVLAGLLILPVVGHPDIFETGFADASR